MQAASAIFVWVRLYSIERGYTLLVCPTGATSVNRSAGEVFTPICHAAGRPLRSPGQLWTSAAQSLRQSEPRPQPEDHALYGWGFYMLGFLPPVVRGVLSFLVLVLNTLFWCVLLFVLALLKFCLPFDVVLARLDPLINAVASAWTSFNCIWMRLAHRTHWTVEGVQDLRYKDWYLVNCNHQSWVDIFVLQDVLNGRIPVLKFFLKAELIYLPVIGLAWWALDFPFMKRHSRAALRKNPNLRNDDRDSARKACAKFAKIPTSVMNFVEGTRFTAEKHQTQASPYRHLLKPKAGAMAMALNAMGAQFHSLVDATIAYPDGIPTFWQYLCGQSPRVIVKVRQVEIPLEFCTGDYENDRALRKSFHRWLDEVWQCKDADMDEMLALGQTAKAG